MKIKNYTPTKGFIWILLLIIFIAWLVYKCVPLTEKDQDALIHSNMERERIRLAEEFDSYTQEDFARLPKFDSRKYFLIKRSGRFWLIPREYQGDSGFKIRWPTDVNKLLAKNGKMILIGIMHLMYLCIHLNIIIVRQIIGGEKFIIMHPVNQNLM